MANSARRLAHNAPGDFYVDATCIDCDTCGWMASAMLVARTEHGEIEASAYSDEDGRFVVENLLPGVYRMEQMTSKAGAFVDVA